MNRGALPLAILIVAALAAGIAVAVVRPGELGEERAGPPVIETEPPTSPRPVEPTAPVPTDSPEPTDGASPEPTDGASPEPTDEPTEEPSPEPTDEPTDEPSPEPTNGEDNENGEALAETGGPVLPWLFGGAALFSLGVWTWRLRRRLI